LFVFRPEEQALLMLNAALPHLRLLSLPEEELGRFLKSLITSEDMWLFRDVHLSSFSQNAEPRTQTDTSHSPCRSFWVEVIPEELLENNRKVVDAELSEERVSIKWEMHLTACKSFYLQGMQLLTRAKNYPELDPLCKICKRYLF